MRKVSLGVALLSLNAHDSLDTAQTENFRSELQP